MANIYKASSVTMAEDAVPIEIGETPEPPETGHKSSAIISRGKNDLLEEAEKKAEIIILKARNEAQLIKDNTETEIKKLRAETEEGARKQGYDEGFKKGAQEAEKLKGEARETLRDMQDKREDTLRGIEPQAVELISKILGKLVGGAVKINPQIILYLIREGLSESTGTEGTKIRISPDDFNYVQEHFNEITMYSGSQDIELIKDAGLKPMDCIIETAYGNIDSSLNQQLESLQADLLYIFNNRLA